MSLLVAKRGEWKSWDIPWFILLDLGLNVIKSVTSEERKSRNRCFAKRVSPLRVNHWKWLYNIYQSGLNTYRLQDRTVDYLIFSSKTYDFPLNMKSMQKALQNYLSLINDKISRVFGGNLSFRNELSLPKMFGRSLEWSVLLKASTTGHNIFLLW